jgi:hypothetical protein
MRRTPDPHIHSEPEEVSAGRVHSGTERLDVVDDLPLAESERRVALQKLTRQIEAVTCYVEESTNNITRKWADAAEAARRAHDFEVLRHNSFLRMSWTILMFMLLVMVSCLAFSVWMIASGREQGGIVLAVATIGGLAYLAGFGTPRGRFWRGGPDSESGA